MKRYHVTGTRTLGTSIRRIDFSVLAIDLESAYDAASDALWDLAVDGASYVFRVEESCQISRLAS